MWVRFLNLHTRSGVDLKRRKWGLTRFRFCLFFYIILHTLLIFKKILDWCRRVWRGLGTGSGIWTRLWPGLSATVATLACFHCIHTGLPCKFVVSLHHLLQSSAFFHPFSDRQRSHFFILFSDGTFQRWLFFSHTCIHPKATFFHLAMVHTIAHPYS